MADIAQHLIAILCFFVQNGYAIYDDVNDRKIAGLEEFSGLVDVDEPFPLTFTEQYALTEATAELATACYAGVLMLQAMGLGGWMFDGIDRFSMLGASGNPDVPGLGFRYDEDERWSTPNPTGREGVFEAYCPPHYPDMAAAVEAFAERKFGPGGPFNRDTPGAWSDSPGVRGSAQVHDEEFKACVALQAQYVFDTFGRFPGTVPTVFILNYVQAHHLDLDFYDRFFKPGAYLRTPRRAHAALARPAGGGLAMGEHVRAGELDIWTEQVGDGPDVLLIGGAGDTVESWQFQLDGLADRYRLIAFDNRGAGRTAMPDEPVSIEVMADDAAACPPRARRPLGPRGGLLGRQHRLPGAGAAPPRAGAQPSAAEHLAGDGPLLPHVGSLRPMAGRVRTQRARVPRGVLPRHLHRRGHTTTGPSTSSSRRCSRFLTSRGQRTCSATSSLSSTTTRPTACPRSLRPRSCSPAAATRAPAPPLGRRVAELIPGGPVRGDGRGGAPALPGGPGRVERPRRRLLAGGRGTGLKSSAGITDQRLLGRNAGGSLQPTGLSQRTEKQEPSTDDPAYRLSLSMQTAPPSRAPRSNTAGAVASQPAAWAVL